MKVIQTPTIPIKCWTDGVLFEEEAQRQLMGIATLPFIYKWIAVMPDVHAGKGSTIGTVLPTVGAIIPSCVGVDIGCGMQAVRTNLVASDLPDNLHAIRHKIEQDIPHGSNPKEGKGRGAWAEIPEHVAIQWGKLSEKFAAICLKHPRLKNTNNISHLGTLGGGNHFIEICLDENQHVWFMLHSGSRGVGNAIGTHFIELAKKDMARYFINLPDKDLAYLPEGSQYFGDYVSAVFWAQSFAKLNRDIMMNTLINSVSNMLGREIILLDEIVDCHHNYISKESHYDQNIFVTRKGAVRARQGDMGIIPGSMGAKSFIVRGLGNPESFHSCSHGAGRVMSRTKAKSLISEMEHKESLKGVECRNNASTLDETPACYKNIDDVMAAQSDLVEIVHTLKQILVVKG